MKMCTELKAKCDFVFINPETNRKNKVKSGQIFWVTSSETAQAKNKGAISIARKGQNMAEGKLFPLEIIEEYFEVLTN